MSSSLEQLKAERGALAQRLSDSQREVQQIREALKAQQDKLSLLEAQKGEHAEQLAKVAQLISDAEAKSAVVGPELTARLIGPLSQERHAVQAALQRVEAELGGAHASAAQVAQQLGPAFQKQKRFEEALSALDAMLETSSGSAAAASSVSAARPTPPPLPQRSMKPAEPAQSTSERRPVRVPLKTSISFELEVDQQSEHNFYTGFTDNISEGGLFIATDQKIDLGVEISFQLSLPTLSAPVAQRGVVRWVRYASEPSEGSPNGVGVQFVELTPQVKAAVEAFIKGRESIFYDED